MADDISQEGTVGSRLRYSRVASLCSVTLRGNAMQVSQLMSTNVQVAGPDDTLRRVARAMAELGAGVLPVCEAERLIGMVTDRDLVVRGLGVGLDPDAARVRDVMSAQVHFCYEDDDVEEVVQSMAEWQIRRLPVLNLDKKLIGIVSLGDIAQDAAPVHSGSTLRDISAG
jgi:CBS domain-containing protein